jgi:hypothetical protein
MTDRLHTWIEKRLGRKVERSASGFLVTRAELDILAAAPRLRPWRMIVIFGASFFLVQAAMFIAHYYGLL